MPPFLTEEADPAQTRDPEPVRTQNAAAAAFHPVSAGDSRQQQLVPVPASVFDDEFFTKGNEELRAERTWAQEAAAAKPAERATEPPPTHTHWPEARVPSFGGLSGEPAATTPESDELDIPAFLRRSH